MRAYNMSINRRTVTYDKNHDDANDLPFLIVVSGQDVELWSPKRANEESMQTHDISW